MLEIKDVFKTFNAGTINEKRALNGVNLKLNEGDFVTIIGGNGAGKSTTLNMIAGVYPIDRGTITIDGVDVGFMGQVHPLVCKNYGIDVEVYCAEINFSKLFEMRLPEPTYVPLPKYPSVWRDLAVVCDEALTVAEVESVMTAAAGKLLRSIRLFDIYRGTGIPEGKKSVAFSLELRADDRTLTDTDSEGVVTKVLNDLKEKLNIELR